MSDIEKDAGRNPRHQPLGFAALASWMASDGDQELIIFRKFDEISLRNLLYLQCEVQSIEAELKEWDQKVASSGNTALERAAETWEIMVEQAKEAGPAERAEQAEQTKTIGCDAKTMMDLVLKLRVKIKEYHEALDLQSRVAQLRSPDRRTLKAARNELHGGPLSPDGSKPCPILGGKAKDYLDTEGDLVSLKAPAETDPLSRLLREHWPGKEEVSRDGMHRISRFEERSITIAVALINIIVAISLLVGSITSLYFVTSPAAILGMICAFTIVFALSVGLMTNAKRAEIFAASAAYAAVLVVFVSNDNLSGNS
ncbi:hypothetical protein FDECE_7703 [Fusarium decemcellulare]|nr:hypothetical protein FDECE_7703 [Fusarium decemcellulare]